MPSRCLLIPIALAVVLSACAAQQADPLSLPVEPFAGHVTVTDTGTWFVPCGGSADDKPWWVTWVDRAVRQVDDAKKGGLLALNERTFVRWRASRTDDRLVGPGGPALLVRDIFEIRAPRASDCAPPTR